MAEEDVAIERAIPKKVDDTPDVENDETVTDVTPSSWRKVFEERQYTDPTKVPPYDWKGGDLAVGYPKDAPGAAFLGQRLYITAGSEIAYVLDLVKEGQLSWLTLEFKVPRQILAEHRDLTFALRGAAMRAPFVAALKTYRRTKDGKELREGLGQFSFSMQPQTFSKAIPVAERENIEEFKFFLEFNTAHFFGCAVDAVKLLAPAHQAKAGKAAA